MSFVKVVSICAASALALALFDVPAAEAAKRSFSAAPRMAVKRPVASRTTKKQIVTKRVVVKKVVKPKREIVKATPKVISKPSKAIVKGPLNGKALNKQVKFVPNVKLGKANLKNLPIHKAVGGNAVLKARLVVPQNIKPKLSLVQPPKQAFQMKLSPFIQKQWKKPFFWVAVAGLGYLTVPEYYYDRFVSYVNLNDPDYDECVKLLSYAALEDEDYYMVREPMPRSATYRYSVKTAPPPLVKDAALTPGSGDSACALTPFVERKWNRSFVWVQVPETGSVSVPEDYYDRFYGHVSGEPPNFTAACQVLVEAAAADMMAATTVDGNRPVYN